MGIIQKVGEMEERFGRAGNPPRTKRENCPLRFSGLSLNVAEPKTFTAADAEKSQRGAEKRNDEVGTRND